ncbi:hypothetical protein FKR81_00385 [Lentzea tibetensis]|uniref:Uncharacterized protein n=1 Tax=Lentzea tibetensis TaxID=2591470 RepID=A0A563F3X5_9PSEU|nr:hypothetical protein [Lentzea tibetensis]TWP54064.1 hypothetical protein FKR81_00385 [Lentzea tibetensis]
MLTRSSWEGGDADDFRWQWDHLLSGLLIGIASAVRDCGDRVQVNAEQQRVASGDHGGSGSPFFGAPPGFVDEFLRVYDGFGVALGGLGLAGGVAGLVGMAVDGSWKGGLAKGIAGLVNGSPDFVRNIVGKDIGVVGKGFDLVGRAAEFAMAGIDAYEFGESLGREPDSEETYNKGADLVFSGTAVVVGVVCPPLGVAIGAAGFAYGLWTDANPSFTRDFVWGARDVVGDVGGAIGDGAEAVGDVISGGVNALLDRF